MASSETERTRTAVGNGIVELGLTADELTNFNNHVESLWGILGKVEVSLRGVHDRIQEANHLPGMAKDCSKSADDKLGLAARYFNAAKGSGSPKREALPQNTLDIQERVGTYTAKITDVEARVEAVGRQLVGMITEVKDIVGICIGMSDVNGEVNGTLSAVAEQSKVAADLHANL